MKLLWRGAWIETPGYEVPGSGILISVAAAVPLIRVENASGRLTRRPGRKVATFLLTDGPARTLRKARTKRDEPRFTGDFRVSVVLGEVIGSGGPRRGPGFARAGGRPAAGGPPQPGAAGRGGLLRG